MYTYYLKVIQYSEINSYNDPNLIKADVTSCELYLVKTNFISL